MSPPPRAGAPGSLGDRVGSSCPGGVYSQCVIGHFRNTDVTQPPDTSEVQNSTGAQNVDEALNSTKVLSIDGAQNADGTQNTTEAPSRMRNAKNLRCIACR